MTTLMYLRVSQSSGISSPAQLSANDAVYFTSVLFCVYYLEAQTQVQVIRSIHLIFTVIPGITYTATLPRFYHNNKLLYCILFYEINNRCNYMQSIPFHCQPHSTCLGCHIHPSSGVQFSTAPTATGTNHTIVSATYSQ